MQKLLSLPPNLVEKFYDLLKVDRNEWFVTSDPVGVKLGSGGGTAWLMRQWHQACQDADHIDRRIILHAGGQSRRLPAYAPSGKILTPIPIFRWERGQRIDQTLLSLQLPLYERIMTKAPARLRNLIASGDVYIRSEQPLEEIPDVDVVCYGLWVDPVLATHHGVFVANRETPDRLECMLQKPSLDKLEELASDYYFLMDIGIWLLSDRAMELLCRRSVKNPGATSEPWADLGAYDMYSEFGGALGDNPTIKGDDEVNSLTVAILPLPGGEFYHYGTSRELISSTTTVQNKVYDQRRVLHRALKPNPSLFVQNTDIAYRLSAANESVWVENAHVPASWTLTNRNIVTGVPYNNWRLKLPEGVCLDIAPIKGGGYAVRPYGFDDLFKGDVTDEWTKYLGTPMPQWLGSRNIAARQLGRTDDLQAAKIFPVVDNVDDMYDVIDWMISHPTNNRGAYLWHNSKRLSADDISAEADLEQLFDQRREFCRISLDRLSKNHNKSIFYQLDLDNLARHFVDFGMERPDVLPTTDSLEKRIHNYAFRSRIATLRGQTQRAAEDERNAFGLLSESIIGNIRRSPQRPTLNVYADQIVWGRSPVRIDLAGGWTDTPPYSILNGGSVVNLAVEINGQPPLQVYVKPSKNYEIVLRSIDLSAIETITEFSQLAEYNKVGSPFSIPKAALCLAGFVPGFCAENYPSLQQQLKAFGCGLELTLLSAIPAGSGLGTSSILAATVLGALSDFCGLGWNKNEICMRTLALEQLLTTGGGWQDQYGGVLHGVKLLHTIPSMLQVPMVSWLPDYIFTAPDYRDCHLLYYTGITRTAKTILSEIVRGMFLNSESHLWLLQRMKEHARDMANAIQHANFEDYGKMVAATWQQNMSLDAGTNPPQVAAIINRIQDYCSGYKLPGAGGGGFLYMVAKDPKAASRIRTILQQNAPNRFARFVDFALSTRGFQVSRS